MEIRSINWGVLPDQDVKNGHGAGMNIGGFIYGILTILLMACIAFGMLIKLFIFTLTSFALGIVTTSIVYYTFISTKVTAQGCVANGQGVKISFKYYAGYSYGYKYDSRDIEWNNVECASISFDEDTLKCRVVIELKSQISYESGVIHKFYFDDISSKKEALDFIKNFNSLKKSELQPFDRFI